MTRLLLIPLCSLMLFGCQPQKSYIRTYTHVPQTGDAGDLETSGTIAFNHLEGMLAFSPIEHVNILAQGYAGTRGTVYDLGLGTYYRHEQLKVQLSGGFGRGILNSRTFPYRTSTNSYQDTRIHFYQNSSFDKFFIQPSIEFFINEAVSFGCASRLNWVHYTKWELKEIREVDNYPDIETPYVLLDRSAMVKDVLCFVNLRKEKFCASIQYGRTEDTFDQSALPRYTEGFLNIAFGLNLSVFQKQSPSE